MTISLHLRNLCLVLFSLLSTTTLKAQTAEYLWYEAENMRGFTTGKLGEPLLNPSHLNLSRAKAPGWGMNGPGVSAEWTQGGESEWNSAAASADESRATLYQDLEIPRTGQYLFWVRMLIGPARVKTSLSRSLRMAQKFFVESLARKTLSIHTMK